MSLGDAHRFHELVERVERLVEAAALTAEAHKAAMATLTLRVNALQGQINALRAKRQHDPPEETDDAA